MIDDILLASRRITPASASHTPAPTRSAAGGDLHGDTNDVTLTSQQTVRIHDYVTARIRLGAAYGRFLPYVTFGGAVGPV